MQKLAFLKRLHLPKAILACFILAFAFTPSSFSNSDEQSGIIYTTAGGFILCTAMPGFYALVKTCKNPNSNKHNNGFFCGLFTGYLIIGTILLNAGINNLME